MLEIAGHRIFTEVEAVTALKKLHDAGVSDFPLTFAPEAKLTAAQVRRNTNEANLIAPNTKWKGNELPSANLKKLLATIAPGEDDFDEHIPEMSIHSLRCIASAKTGWDFSEENVSTESIQLMNNYL